MEKTPSPINYSSESEEEGDGVPSSPSAFVGGQNPMENAVVVRQLLGYCVSGVESLKTFALVSRVWYEATRPRWNAIVNTLRIYPTEEQRNHQEEDGIQVRERVMILREFARKAMKKDTVLQKFPNSKYDLRFWDLLPNHFGVLDASNLSAAFNADQSWFWASNRRLSFITHLTMHHCKVHGGTFTMYSEEFLRALPNLQSLKILGASISKEAMKQILYRFSNKSNYFEHPKIQKVYLEPLIPMEMSYKALSVLYRSMTIVKYLYVRELRGQDVGEEYKIADFTPGRCNLLHQILRHRPEGFDVVEYTSSNPEHRTFRNYPVHSRLGISSFPGTFEVFSGLIQDENGLRDGGNEEDGSPKSFFSLDMYACPFSTVPETHVCSDTRLKKISLWGGFACSLSFLRNAGNLEELTYNTSCFGNKVHRAKVLKFLNENNEGAFQDKNPFGGGNEVEIDGETINKWVEPEKGFSNGDCKRHGVRDSPPRESNTSSRRGGRTIQWQRFRLENVDGTMTLVSVELKKKKNEALGGSVRKLDIDFRFKEEYSWESLGKVFPCVVDLKGVIQGHDQLEMVRNVWPGLKRLVIGHGSSHLSLERIMEVVDGLEHLKEFEWKGCACLGPLSITRIGSLMKTQMEVEIKLMAKNIKYTVPWGRKKEGEMQEICLEKVFDDAMQSGRISRNHLDLLLAIVLTRK